VVAIRGAAFSAETVAGESRPKDLALTDHAIADGHSAGSKARYETFFSSQFTGFRDQLT
jgi:hypothetical protein